MTPEERADLVARDKKFVWHPYTQMERYRAEVEPLVIERAEGARLHDVDGRVILDGNASWWTSLLGHNHPRLVAALKNQADKLCHTSLAGVTHEPAVRFAEAILSAAPRGLNHVFFSDNGSTAVEAALKLCIQYWAQTSPARPGKNRFLSLSDAFHGETMGVTSLSGVEAFRSPFAGLTFPTVHLPSPADGLEAALDALRSELATGADTIAALVVEPMVQGAGGMRFYDAEFLREARELTRKYDVLLVVDEVFTGYGRTGKFWASEHADIEPDVVATAKGLSGGLLPFAATLVSSEVESGFLGDASRAFYYGHTFCGNPLGAAVATEVLAVYRDEDVLAGVEPRARMLRETFSSLGELPGVQDARALGMCAALNLQGGRGYLERGGWDVFEEALRQGAYVRPLGNVVYLVPAINIELGDLRKLLDIVSESVRKVVARRA